MRSGCCTTTPAGFLILGHVIDFPTVGTTLVMVINGQIYRAIVENCPVSDTSAGSKESIYYASANDTPYDGSGNAMGNSVEAGAFLSRPFVGILNQYGTKYKNTAAGIMWYSHNQRETSTPGNSGTAVFKYPHLSGRT